MWSYGSDTWKNDTPTTPPSSAPRLWAAETVTEASGVYHVVARFAVAESPDVVLGVLTDYERIPRFMPDLTTSIVRARDGCRVLIEQEAVAKMMMFSKRVHLLLEVHEQTNALRFVDRSGKSFNRYEGAWRIATDGARTTVSYELTAQPAFSVPEFLLTRLLRRDAREMIARLRAEIGARQIVLHRLGCGVDADAHA